jgi:hypothetical protein
VLRLGQTLPVLPLWLRPDLCLPLRVEETYRTTCEGLRIDTLLDDQREQEAVLRYSMKQAAKVAKENPY